jgi:hypothetical protein
MTRLVLGDLWQSGKLQPTEVSFQAAQAPILDPERQGNFDPFAWESG